jgi:hypothetical protein
MALYRYYRFDYFMPEIYFFYLIGTSSTSSNTDTLSASASSISYSSSNN